MGSPFIRPVPPPIHLPERELLVRKDAVERERAELLARLADLSARRDELDEDADFLGEVVSALEMSGETFRAVRTPRIWRRLIKVVENDTTGQEDVDEALARGANQAELFWVSEEMARLASDAATDLPEVHLGRDLWPADYGFMLFDWPIPVTGFQLWRRGTEARSSEAVRAILWAPGGEGLLVAMFSDLTSLCVMIDREQRNVVRDDLLRDMYEWRKEHGDLMGIGVGTFPIDQPISRDDSAQEPHAAILLSTIWLLMQQPLVAEQTKTEIDASMARSLARAKHHVPSVRVVELRRLRGASTAGSTGRTYHQRWAVRGHWRRQWLPSLGMHRPTWVRPHVKGPDDMPFVVSDKVNAWKR